MLKAISSKCSYRCLRFFSLSNCVLDEHSCKVLIVGGGCGGCTIGSKLSRTLDKEDLIILEPSKYHYYQGWFTLCGVGIKRVRETAKPTSDVLPKNATCLRDEAVEFLLNQNTVVTRKGDQIKYDVLVLAVGLTMYWDEIPGLLEALENYDNVGTIYSPMYAETTYKAFQQFESGNMIFTYPHSLVKCAAAPFKVCLLMENMLTIKGLRNEANFFYHTPFPLLHRVRPYEQTLYEIAKKRDINIDLLSNLVAVRPNQNEAIFKHTKTEEQYAQKYAILHVTPPMGPPSLVKNCPSLADDDGYVKVDKYTLQHAEYPNIFAIGDCSNSPNTKTATACASQATVLFENITSVLEGKKCKAAYDGYSSYPIFTAVGKCVLSEYDYDFKPKETFPFSRNRELWMTYFLEKEVQPLMYWNLMLKGYWNDPHLMRRLLHF